MERCPRGRRGTTGNRVYTHKGVPGVRIPLSPPVSLGESRWRKVCLQAVYSTVTGTRDMIAGSRATKGCKPRQVRKEATVAIADVCCG